MRQLAARVRAFAGQSRFLRQAAGMMALTGIGQAVYLIAGPVIGRLFSPADVGLFGLVVTIAISASAVTSLCYDLAVPIVRDVDQARQVTVGAIALAALVSATGGIALWAAAGMGLSGFAMLPAWSGALLFSLLFSHALVQLAQAWCVREDQPMVIGRGGITLSVVRAGFQVGLGFIAPTWWALLAGEAVGRLANLAHLMRGRYRLRGQTRYDADRLRRALWLHREFPIVFVPAQLLDALSVVIQITGLGLMFGPAAMGQYFLMRRTLDLPAAFAVRSLTDLFYIRLAADAQDAPSRVKPFLFRSAGLLAIGGTAAFLPLMMFGSDIFVLVFGPNWAEAGRLAAVMCPAIILNLAIAPISRVFALTTRPQLRFVFSIALNILSAAAIGFAWVLNWSLAIAVVAISAAVSLSYVAYFIAAIVASSHLRPSGPYDSRPPSNYASAGSV